MFGTNKFSVNWTSAEQFFRQSRLEKTRYVRIFSVNEYCEILQMFWCETLFVLLKQLAKEFQKRSPGRIFVFIFCSSRVCLLLWRVYAFSKYLRKYSEKGIWLCFSMRSLNLCYRRNSAQFQWGWEWRSNCIFFQGCFSITAMNSWLLCLHLEPLLKEQ